jgi:hypothetical protein
MVFGAKKDVLVIVFDSQAENEIDGNRRGRISLVACSFVFSYFPKCSAT